MQTRKSRLSAFTERDVAFLVVGAHALAVHGCPRAAGDIEPWIRAEPPNARNVWNALSDFGAPLRDIHPEDFSQPGIVFQTGVPRRRIDILTVLDGRDFEEAWRDRLDIVVKGLALPMLSRPHFLRNKKASGRPEDLADIGLLSGAGRSRPSGP